MTKEINDYLENRVDGQIAWHSQKSQMYQSKFKNIKLLQLLCASILPFMTGLSFLDSYVGYHKLALGFISVVIALSEGVLSLFKYQDLWMQYRNTVELLKREKYQYTFKLGVYVNEENAFLNLVTMVENILSNQTDTWLKINLIQKT